MWRAVGLSLLIGCGGSEAHYAVTAFDLGRANPNEEKIVEGLNLDDRVSDRADATTCGKEDYTSPGPDFEAGVDNQFGPLLGLAPTDPTAAVAPALASGAFAIGIAVEDLAVEMEIGGSTVRFTGEVDDGGRMSAVSDSTLVFDLPVTDAHGVEARMPMKISKPRLRMTVSESGIEAGVLGGFMPVSEAIAGAVVLDFAPEEALLLVLGSNSDLDPDSEGNCQNISAGFVFEATAENAR